MKTNGQLMTAARGKQSSPGLSTLIGCPIPLASPEIMYTYVSHTGWTQQIVCRYLYIYISVSTIVKKIDSMHLKGLWGTRGLKGRKGRGK